MLSRPALTLVFMICSFCLVGCSTSLSYDDPDAPPAPPVDPTATSSPSSATTWSEYATAARVSLRAHDYAAAERNYLASLAATAAFSDRDIRRQTALANPARLVEAYQQAGQQGDAERLTDAVLAEAQGSKPFPLEAWASVLERQLDLELDSGDANTELDRARRIAEIHLGPLQGATVAEVDLHQRVGALLAEAGDLEAARAQLSWAAHASRPLLRMPLDTRIQLQYDAADAAVLAGDPTSAEFLLRGALDLARNSGGEGFREAGALNQLGWFLVEQGHVQQALPLLERARSLLDNPGTPPGLRAATFDSLGVALHRAGRLEEANESFALAIAARETTTPEEQAALVSIDAHWADLQVDLNAAPAANEAPGSPAPD